MRARRGLSALALAIAPGLLLAGLGACRDAPPPPAAPAPKASVSAPPLPSATAGRPAVAPARRRPAGSEDRPRLALGAKGAVASAETHASRIGLTVLERGGNAVDAAVAMGFALAVTHPAAGNIGGGGFMIVRRADGSTHAIDYREVAPGAATATMYLDKSGKPTDKSLVGPLAAGIPGAVAGLALAHARFGSQPWRSLVDPAVALARDGHLVDGPHARSLKRACARMHEAGLHDSAKRFERPDGTPLREGDRLVQKELAATLEAIASGGADAFYKGPLAKRIADAVRAGGGIWTAADLAGYQAKLREPVRFTYRGHTVISMPPPSAGGVVLRHILGASEQHDFRQFGHLAPQAVHLYVEATRRAYADRNALLADPDVIDVPLKKLLSAGYVAERMKGIDTAKATASTAIRPGLPPPKRSEQTTHYSVIDGRGGAVATTTTLNTSFGSKFVVPGAGFLLNNEMDDFSVKPGSANVYGLVQNEQNRIEPGKRMLSSMTPTLLLDDKGVRAALGTPGGPTITTTVAQLVMAIVDHGLPLDRAVAAPRIHHQWLPDRIDVERTTPASLIEALERRGHEVRKRPPIGHAHGVEVDPTTRGFRAVADVTRGGGSALAY